MKITRAATLDEALGLIATGAVPVTGGTGLQLVWSQGAARPEHMVAIGHLIPAGITMDKRITIGAGTTLEEIRQAGLPLLSEGARDVAAPNIRRLATLGGTIGFGAGCLLPALLALDAEVATTHGTRPLGDWLANPEGLVLEVTVTRAARTIWRKTGLRAGFTAALIVSAGDVEVEDDRITRARLAVGGGPVRPVRLGSTEDWLAGQSLSKLDQAELIVRLEAEIDAPGCAFRTGAYRRKTAARALAFGIIGRLPEQGGRHLSVPAKTEAPALTRLSRAEGGNRWHTRPDMPPKVHGQMRYLTDARVTEAGEDMLIGRILRAAHPHAEILSIDTSAAEALPGVKAVVTHRDIKGENSFGIVFQDQPALCADKVRYIGDPVAAVAAIDTETAKAALDLIKVEYRLLPLVTDPEAALAPEAPLVHESGNLVNEVGLTRGDADVAFAEAAFVVEDTYVTPRQMHGFMETEGGWARPDGDGLFIAAGGQHGGRDRMQLARILGLPEDKIRVVTSPIGGGFGGKDELTIQPALALLAFKAQAPVRLQLSRAESVIAGTKRNPMRIRMRTGCDATGKLIAQEVELISDCGAYASLSPGVMETAMEHCAGPYVIENIRTRGRTAYTNNGTGGAFRGFGANQMTYAIECQIEKLAQLTGQDPATIRRMNLRSPGMPGYLGQRVAPSERLFEMVDAAAASDIWDDFEVGPDEIAGVGMALNHQGNGLGTMPLDEADFAIGLRDGKIEVLCGLDEMGQGLVASAHAAAADRLGCARDDLRVIFGDTGRTPDSGSTTASRGGYVVWQGVENCAPGLTTRLLACAGDLLGRDPADLTIVPGGVGEAIANDPTPLITFADLGDIEPETTHFAFPETDYKAGNARFIFAFGATLARVAVNRVTGVVRVVKLEFHSAAGPVIDMASYLGQMEGGMIQGLGFTLTEDALMADGQMVTKNLDTYVMPTVRDVPEEISATALEDLDPGDPFGPRGAGELGIGAVTPAIANAVADAIGHWPAVTPFPPEEILAMLEAAE